MNHFDTIPEELKFTIFNYLDGLSLLSSSKVCHEWNRLCNEETLWKQLCLAENPQLHTSQDQDPNLTVLSDWKGYFTSSACQRVGKSGKGNIHHLFGIWSITLILLCFVLSLAGTFYVAKQHYILKTFVPTQATIKTSQLISLDEDGIEDEDDGPNYNYLPIIVYEYECAEDDDDTIYDPFFMNDEDDLGHLLLYYQPTPEDNATFTSSDLFPLSPLTSPFGEEEYAKSVVSEYKVGQTAIIYRHPDDCSDAFLLRYTDFSVYLIAILPMLAIYLIIFCVFRVKRAANQPIIKKEVKNDTNTFKCLQFYDHDFRSWVCETLPSEPQKFNFQRLLYINMGMSTLLHLIGTGCFLHFYLFGEEESNKLETGIFYTALCVAFQAVSLLPVFNAVKYYRLNGALSDMQIFLKGPCFVAGSPMRVYLKQDIHQEVHVKLVHIYLTRYRTVYQRWYPQTFFAYLGSSTRSMWKQRRSVVADQITCDGEKLLFSTVLNVHEAQPPTTENVVVFTDGQKVMKDSWFLTVKVDMDNLPTYAKELQILVRSKA